MKAPFAISSKALTMIEETLRRGENSPEIAK
jgi:hypothetical protein